MKSNKSTGLDNISNEMLKSLNCFTMGYYPENWTHGCIPSLLLQYLSIMVFRINMWSDVLAFFVSPIWLSLITCKSPGLDNISNEMLKSGQSFLIPCLHNFSITVLQWVITLKIGHMDILLQSIKGTIPSVILPSISVKHFIFSSWLSLSSAILENIFWVIQILKVRLPSGSRY
jgi:hypothetical protein